MTIMLDLSKRTVVASVSGARPTPSPRWRGRRQVKQILTKFVPPSFGGIWFYCGNRMAWRTGRQWYVRKWVRGKESFRKVASQDEALRWLVKTGGGK